MYPYLLLAVDPGTTESAYVIIKCKEDDQIEIVEKGKVSNNDMRRKLQSWATLPELFRVVGIEHIKSYGQRVGQEVFDTCAWIGRFQECITETNDVYMIFRTDVKKVLSNNKADSDSALIHMMVDRYAYNVPNSGKGNKKDPGFFYGFKKDIWQAFAVAIALYDIVESDKLSGYEVQGAK